MREEKHFEGESDGRPPITLKSEELLSILSTQIAAADRKLSSGRIRNKTTEQARVSLMRTLTYAIQTFRFIERDGKIAELEQRINALEEVRA